MNTRVLHRGSTGTHDTIPGCHEKPPVFESVERTCTPCEEVAECGSCPEKTKARHSEAIGHDEGQRCVSLRGRGCAPQRLPMFMHCITMKVRKKGQCAVLTTEVPYKAKYDGSACFNWSKRFKQLPNGYYEGDIYIDGKSCVTWPFHIQDCYMTITTDSTEDLQPDCTSVECASVCNRCSGSCECQKPPLEEEIGDVAGNCGDCEKC